MRLISARTTAFAVIAILLAGCGQDSNPVSIKTPVVKAVISVTVTQPQTNPGDPVELRVRLTNEGTERIEINGCSGHDLVRAAILLDENSAVVYDYWPFPFQVICTAIWFVGPGETLEFTREFSGQLYTQPGDAYIAPSGTYTLRSSVRFGTGSGDRYSAEGSAAFSWVAP